MANKKESIEVAKWILERQLTWISSAEVKLGAVITIGLAMLGAEAVAFSATQLTLGLIGTAVFVSTFLLLIFSLISCGISIISRLECSTDSLIFFGMIAKKTSKKYIQELKALTDEDLLDDLGFQIHRNAQIATTKHKWAKLAVLLTYLSLPLWVTTLILWAVK